MDIVLTAALNLHADGVLRGIALDRSSIQLPFQIDGKKEIREINMEFNARYVRGDMDKEEKKSCPM